MRRIKVKRRHEVSLEQRFLESQKENRELKDENWSLRNKVIDFQRKADDASNDYIEAKKQIQGYRNEAIGERVDREKVEVAYAKLEYAYEDALAGISCMSEEWYDRHLNETHNVLKKEPFGVEYET